MNNNAINPLSSPLLTTDQAKALALLARWKNQTVETFCLDAIQAGLYRDYWELRKTAETPPEQNYEFCNEFLPMLDELKRRQNREQQIA